MVLVRDCLVMMHLAKDHQNEVPPRKRVADAEEAVGGETVNATIASEMKVAAASVVAEIAIKANARHESEVGADVRTDHVLSDRSTMIPAAISLAATSLLNRKVAKIGMNRVVAVAEVDVDNANDFLKTT
jgi:hypothetical protein